MTAAGCGSSRQLSRLPNDSLRTPGASASPERSSSPPAGTADVAYAGSLQLLNEKVIGPEFTKATGYAYQGRGGGSFGLSKEILASEITPNVFESVGAAPIEALEPKLTTWYVQFASSPIVVAYNPSGRYGPQLAAIAKGKQPLASLFTLMDQPGFRLGRTNPETDPQGQAFYEMVELAQARLGLPAGTARGILGPVDNPSQVFAETALEARLQAGQLDAASAFLSQAVQLHLPYIPLPSSIDFGDPALAGSYSAATLTLPDGRTLHGVPLVLDITTLGVRDRRAAAAFVAFVLSPAGRRALRAGGYQLLAPTASGRTSDIPLEVRDELAHSS